MEGRPLPFFCAVPAELEPLNRNCHLQDFNGQPAVHSSGRGPEIALLAGRWGLWRSSAEQAGRRPGFLSVRAALQVAGCRAGGARAAPAGVGTPGCLQMGAVCPAPLGPPRLGDPLQRRCPSLSLLAECPLLGSLWQRVRPEAWHDCAAGPGFLTPAGEAWAPGRPWEWRPDCVVPWRGAVGSLSPFLALLSLTRLLQPPGREEVPRCAQAWEGRPSPWKADAFPGSSWCLWAQGGWGMKRPP